MRYRVLKKIQKILVFLIILMGVLFLTSHLLGHYIENNVRFYPDYEKIDLIPILEKEALTKEDYKTLFYQTGLGPIAIDEIRARSNYKHDMITSFQEDFFHPMPYQPFRSGVITAIYNVDEDGNQTEGFQFAPFHNGYVFVTDASHTLGYRHGHSAVITDAKRNQSIEALTYGEPSSLAPISSWRYRPTFIMLRLKDASQETLDEIAKYAVENLLDIPYTLTVGIFSAKNPSLERLKGTHCSHLVWYLFKQFGYDIDADGGIIVTPRDIMRSEWFDVIQIYGLNPDDYWDDE